MKNKRHNEQMDIRELLKSNLFNLWKERLDIPLKTDFMSLFNERLNECCNVSELVKLMSELIQSHIETIHDERQYIKKKPIRIAKEYMQQHYNKPLTLEEISGVVGFNSTYFSYLFKKTTDMNFLECLTTIRIEKAKELLISTDHTIADLCGMVGYADTKYFSKLFKKATGLSPSEYRKLYQ